MAGGGGDEFTALLGQDRGDALGILASQSLAGENDHTGIDLVGVQIGGDVSVVDDGAELGVIDALLALVRRQRHRRLEQCLARDDVIAAGQILGEAAQVNAREDDLRARGTNVDTDRGQRDIILAPERIVLERNLVILEIVVVIVVVVGIFIVLVHEILTVEVIGKTMARRFLVFFVVGVRHSYPKWSRVARGSYSRARRYGSISSDQHPPGEIEKATQSSTPGKL